MIAWSSVTLDNLDIQNEADKAHRQGCISPETQEAIRKAHPVDLYTPNLVIRIGLFLLTCIVIAFTSGFFLLLALGSDTATGFRVAVILASLLCIGVLEFAISQKKPYRSGINEALLWSAVGLFCCGIFIENYDLSENAWALTVLILTALGTLRYADMVSSAVAYLAFLLLVFWQVMKIPYGTAVMPFLLMGISLAVYLASSRLVKRRALRHYSDCLTVLRVLSLITLYMAGNYFVVRETNSMLLMPEAPTDIPAGWLFWALTVIIPPLYIYLGVRKKDAVLLRTGVILVAMIVFTIRHYHSVMPLETAMAIGGLVLTGGAWALIRYLHTPKNGFTYAPSDEAGMADQLKVESLIIAQTFPPTARPADTHPNFGGGSGGGGGASGDF
ncbi:hypothetical protein HF329_18690 [Chitinophaga oryzae]|uniref:DUF2157 domain-containing protein n=1 Tax=Chitinophaga oryzae TaxID=2725414 RepID=A0AAE6ZK66_9BACT|nr:hypothetical protein [Chitinophaga oryzae]QJB33234.1 hypothetical protein HF329_18690 [Chitinophaga oryzae]